MYATKTSSQNGSSQVRRSLTAGLPRATSMNSAIADSTASDCLVTRIGNPSASSCAASQRPSAKCAWKCRCCRSKPNGARPSPSASAHSTPWWATLPASASSPRARRSAASW